MDQNFYKIPAIDKGDKVIVGLGDSFTQGVGSWSKATYKFNGNRIPTFSVPDSLNEEMYANSWVNQLCENHLPEWKGANLGKMGTGNRAAIKELYLYPNLRLDLASEVIVIFLLSGIERFDFINRNFKDIHHFFTMWPNAKDRKSSHRKLWQIYAKDIWSYQFEVIESLLNIKEAEAVCTANGFKLVLASGFEQRFTKEYFYKNIGKEHVDLVNTIPWEKFCYPQDNDSFIELLLRLEGKHELTGGAFYKHYMDMRKPSKYISNCAHPSQTGHKIIAEEFYKHLTDTLLE